MKAGDDVFVTGNEFTPELEIKTVKVGRPHVVILGAGASRAACSNGDANGRSFPVMDDLVDLVGLADILSRHGVEYTDQNFESIYSSLAKDPELDKCRRELEQAISDYFMACRIPDAPTIYDHLVLSLRPRDVIATFNWDPLLVQAARRNSHVVDLPRFLFLHGNVAVGYCARDSIMGYLEKPCSKCECSFEPTPLLYPVEQKGYSNSPFIHAQWQDLHDALREACLLTIFGYSAPSSDVEAINLLQAAWGAAEQRNMEQIEIIDIKPESVLHATWSNFIHSHHYGTTSDFYESSIARHPRRTGEAYAATHLYGMWEHSHPLPKDAGFQELWSWYAPLVEHERRPGVAQRDRGNKLPVNSGGGSAL